MPGTYHRIVYVAALCLISAGLPFSHIALSLGQIILAVHWLSETNYKQKLQALWQNKAALAIMSIWLIHALGLIYSSDFEYGLKDVRVKLPLLTLPFFIASQPKLTYKELRWILGVFSLAVISGTLITYTHYYFTVEEIQFEPRSISFFISHIRFGLMIALTIFLWRYVFPSFWKAHLIISIWLIFYLLETETVTGLFFIAIGTIIWTYYSDFKSSVKRYLTRSLILVFFIISGFIGSEVWKFYQPQGPILKPRTTSLAGTPYTFETERQQYENGYPVWAYLAISELESEWAEKSEIPFNGTDNLGQPLYSTLIRFLTSKGAYKDAEAIKALSQDEVNAIESGISNIRLMSGRDFGFRIYQIIWEFDAYFKGYNPSGNSITQRFVFWQNAVNVIIENPILGVGTGDVKEAISRGYDLHFTDIDKAYRKRAHNQYLTITVALGIIGLIGYVLVLLLPIFISPSRNYLFWIFYSMLILSATTEDIFERQISTTFYSLFWVLFWVNGLPNASKLDDK